MQTQSDTIQAEEPTEPAPPSSMFSKLLERAEAQSAALNAIVAGADRDVVLRWLTLDDYHETRQDIALVVLRVRPLQDRDVIAAAMLVGSDKGPGYMAEVTLMDCLRDSRLRPELRILLAERMAHATDRDKISPTQREFAVNLLPHLQELVTSDAS